MIIWAVMRVGGAFRRVGRFGWQGGGGSGRLDSAGQPVGSATWKKGFSLRFYYSGPACKPFSFDYRM